MPGKVDSKPRSSAYAAPVDPKHPEGQWRCTRDECEYVGPNRGAVQLHQKTHQAHKHKWRVLRANRANEARAIGLGFSKVCETCDELE